MKNTKHLLLATLILFGFVGNLLSESNSAIQPVPRLDKFWDNHNRGSQGWVERHGKILVRNQKGPVDLIFLGDSITHAFDNLDSGFRVWQRDFAKWNPVNMGFGGDKTEHVLWRIDHGALDNISPKAAVVMIGTNNARANSPEQIAEGVFAVCHSIHEKLPDTQVLLLAIFPRNDPDDERRSTVEKTNAILKKADLGKWMTYLDIGSAFLNDEGVITQEIMPDLLHPSAKGYELWSAAMLPTLKGLMEE